MIIHFHFHGRATGVTRSIESIIPALNKYSDAAVFGYGINSLPISLRKLLKAIKSDKNKTIIHTHRINEILFALLLRCLGGKFKLVFTRHAESKPANFTYFLMKKADSIVTLSKTMSDNLNLPNTLIPHGINTDLFSTTKNKTFSKLIQKNIIGVVGRIRPAKGQLIVVKAAAESLKSNPKWGLSFIGRIDNLKYADMIYSFAKDEGISKQIRFLPETNHIEDFYSTCDIIVIASQSEGFSLVCLEAMACGLTTIATENVGIHSDVIRHGENGFLFPANDITALKNILEKIILKETSLNPEMIRQTIVDNWSIEKSAERLFHLYSIL
jgi:mannosyltransferase